MSVRVNGVMIQTAASKPWKEAPSDTPKGTVRMRHSEGPEEINACLTCEEPNCTGGQYCHRVKAGRRADTQNGDVKYKRAKKPIPEDFMEVYLTGMPIKDIARHYHVHDVRPYDWLAELGIEPRRGGKRNAENNKNLRSVPTGATRRRAKTAGKKQAVGK